MKQILLAMLVAVVLFGCSSKERESGDHAMSDELEMIEKANEAADLIEQSGFDKQLQSVDGLSE